MIQAAARAHVRLSVVDYLLSAICGVAALLSVGQSIQRPAVGIALSLTLITGLSFSFLVNRSGKVSPATRIDPILYALLASSALLFSGVLNSLLPGEGFPPDLGFMGVLPWMLVLCSFVTWSDSTLLFQSVPSISLFALVGVIEMFSGSTFAFFLFLIATAFLYARAHHRAMLLQAIAAGYQDVATIRSGPWRWVAGPEWSIASAFVVVLASLIGAPVIQSSVKGVAGTVRLSTPTSRTTRPSAIGGSIGPASLRIGTGPRELGEGLVLRVKLDEPRYLRSATYMAYNSGGGWTRANASTLTAGETEGLLLDRRTRIQSGALRQQPFEIILTGGAFEELPVPGDVISLTPALDWRIRPDGTVATDSNLPTMAHISGISMVPASETLPTNAPDNIPRYLRDWLSNFVDVSQTDYKVRNLAREVTAGATNDLERAMAIQQAIAKRCTYNLNAEASPSGSDPVEHFLFNSRQGYCDLFASSMALMARCVGIPSRLATGYYPFSLAQDQEGFYEVHEADAHAWAELYFEGVGWVAFDATEGAAEAPGGGRGGSTAHIPLLSRPWFQWFAGIGLLGLLGYGFMLAVASLKSYRIWRKLDTVVQARAFVQFCTAIQKATNRPRRIYETPSEYLGVVKGKLGALEDEAREICKSFESAFYGNPSSQKSAEDLESRVTAFARALRSIKPAKAAP